MSHKRPKHRHNVTSSSSSSHNNHHTSNETTTSDLPGFYFDPVRNSYFRIQASSNGGGGVVPGLITHASLRHTRHHAELASQTRDQIRRKPQLFALATRLELGGATRQLRVDYHDKLLLKHSLVALFSLDDHHESVKRVSLVGPTPDAARAHGLPFVHVLMNVVNTPYVYRIYRIATEAFFVDGPTGKHSLVALVDATTTERTDERISHLPAHVEHGRFLVSTYQVFSSNYRRTCAYNLSVSEIDVVSDDAALLVERYAASFALPLWCCTLSAGADMYAAVGLPNCAQVNGVASRMSVQLNTVASDAYCVKFAPDGV